MNPVFLDTVGFALLRCESGRLVDEEREGITRARE